MVTMVETQKDKARDDGWKKIENQLQAYISESRKRMEMIEKNQACLNAEATQRQEENIRRMDTLLGHYESE